MDSLVTARASGTIGDVIDILRTKHRWLLPDKVLQREREIEARDANPSDGEEPSSLTVVRELRAVPYPELTSLAAFVNGHTPFSTKHGVKGAEFENVLVVFGRGWNHYNFGQMLEWKATSIPADKEATFTRNQNLFYVVCSRPITRLALLFTQELSGNALSTLCGWFGDENIRPAPR